jgi:Uma2 family endonuclease
MARPLESPIHLFDYLAWDEASDERHEYVGGRVYAMTGGSMRHNRIALNIARLLGDRVDGTACQVFINDMKLHVQAADSVYYPDVFVHCGRGVAGSEKVAQDALLVVEVLSERTAQVDRREKLVAYQKLPGIRAYWIVSQDEQHVEVHERSAQGGWQAHALERGDSLGCDSPGAADIELAQIYAGTDQA